VHDLKCSSRTYEEKNKSTSCFLLVWYCIIWYGIQDVGWISLHGNWEARPFFVKYIFSDLIRAPSLCVCCMMPGEHLCYIWTCTPTGAIHCQICAYYSPVFPPPISPQTYVMLLAFPQVLLPARDWDPVIFSACMFTFVGFLSIFSRSLSVFCRCYDFWRPEVPEF
jgi:hypothetical protein